MSTTFNILAMLSFAVALLLRGNGVITHNEHFELNVYGFFLLLLAQTEDIKNN